MKKALPEMSLEELWQLFPIRLKEHNPQYKEWYEAEKQSILRGIAPENVLRINHIGSSAVKGLLAKPTVDISLDMDGGCDVSQLIEGLKALGWMLMAQKNNPFKLSFNKGYTPDGFADRVYHLHVVYMGDWNELYFRDYLIAHPDIAALYGALKQKLLKTYEFDRDGYTDEKSAFIEKYSAMAKAEYEGKYRPR